MKKIRIPLETESVVASAFFKKVSVATGLALLATSAATQASTDYGPAIWRPLCNANYNTTGNGHKFHVIHDMEGYYANTINWFDNCSMTSASIHYCVNGKQDATSDAPAGEITQLGVRDSQYAWHARCWNSHCTGTEHEGFASNPAWYTDAQYQASAGITRNLAAKFGWAKDRNHVVGHGQKLVSGWPAWASANLGIDPNCNTHTDPGPYWDWTKYMNLVNSGGGGGGSLSWVKWPNGPISKNADGRMQSFAIGTTGNLYTSGQTANNQGTWSAWQNLLGTWGATNWPMAPTVAHNQDGRMQAFLIGSTGHLMTSGQTANNGATWSAWQDLGGNWPGKVPAVSYNLDGRMQVFLVGTTGELFTSGQVSNNSGTWSAWQNLGGVWPADKIPFVSNNGDGRMQVFLIGSTGHLYTSGQVANNGGTWSGWQDLGGTWSARKGAAAKNADGRMQVFVVGTTGEIFTSAQTANNGATWSAWQNLGGYWVGKNPCVGYNQDGRMQVFVVGTTQNLYTSGQVSNNASTWSAWQNLGGICSTDPFISSNGDARMQVFLISSDHALYTSGQVSNNGGTWSTWQSLGGWWPAF